MKMMLKYYVPNAIAFLAILLCSFMFVRYLLELFYVPPEQIQITIIKAIVMLAIVIYASVTDRVSYI